MKHLDAKKHPIPSVLNLAIALGAVGVSAGMLWAASHTSSWWIILPCAWVFSFTNNTIFSLLHEAVHGGFHSNQRVNNWAGRVLAAFYPTAFQYQQRCHLGHHARNRSEVEQFDYIRPDDNKLWKYLEWYTILTGIYWFYVVLGWVLFLVCPWVFRLSVFKAETSKVAEQSSADAMLDSIFKGSPVKMRLEMTFTLAIQVGLILALDLSLVGWLCCYAAFAIRWSGLQYADHAWSELDTVNGAWNLRVNRFVRWAFLNYHYHKAHHQHPSVPWPYLAQYVDPEEEQPSFHSIYLQMWKGPRPFPEAETES